MSRREGMKKRYIWGGLALWALGSGVIVLHMAEGDVEAKVRQWLAVYSCTAEDVKFSLFSDELKIKGINLEYAEDGCTATGRVDSVLLKGVHRGAFDAENGDLTPLADEFSFDGITFASAKADEKYEGSISRLYGKGWYENLATSAQAMLKDKSWRTLLEEMRRYRVDELAYEGYEAKIPVSMPLPDGGVREVMAVSRVDKVSLPGGMGFRPGEEKGELRFSVLSEGIRMDMEDWMNIRAEKTELQDLYVPETDALLGLLEASDLVRNAPPTEAALHEYMGKLSAAWAGHIPFGAFRLEKVECTYGPQLGELPGWSLDEVSCTLDDGVRTEAGLSVKGFRSEGLDRKVAQETGIPRQLREKFLPDGMIVDSSVRVSLAAPSGEEKAGEENAGEAASEPGTVNLAFGIRGLGRTDSVVEVNSGEEVSLQKLLTPDALLENAMISGVNLEYTDEGLIPLAFALVEKESGQSVAELKGEVAALAGSLQMQMGIVGLGKAVGTMVDRPGVLKVSCTFEEPVPLAMMGLFMLGGPDGVEIMAKAEPGTKTLEEMLQ